MKWPLWTEWGEECNFCIGVVNKICATYCTFVQYELCVTHRHDSEDDAFGAGTRAVGGQRARESVERLGAQVAETLCDAREERPLAHALHRVLVVERTESGGRAGRRVAHLQAVLCARVAIARHNRVKCALPPAFVMAGCPRLALPLRRPATELYQYICRVCSTYANETHEKFPLARR